MFKWFSSPYPFQFSFKRTLILALVFGLLSFGLNTLRLSETFAVQHFSLPAHCVSIGFGFIVFISILFVFQLAPALFIKPSKKNNWIVADEIKLIFLLFLVMISFIYIYFVGISNTPDFLFTQSFIIKLLLYFFSASIPFTLMVVWVNYTIILKQNIAKVKEQNQLLKKVVKSSEDKSRNNILIPTNVKKEIIEFNVNDFMFAKSEGNYVILYQKSKNSIENHLYRISINDLKSYLKDYPHLIQVHRSYLVNILNVSHTQGNARNYQLYFENYDGFVPVSRNNFKDFNLALKALS